MPGGLGTSKKSSGKLPELYFQPSRPLDVETAHERQQGFLVRKVNVELEINLIGKVDTDQELPVKDGVAAQYGSQTSAVVNGPASWPTRLRLDQVEGRRDNGID